MRIQLLFILLVGVTLASCQQEPTIQTTPSGFEYILHTDNGGEKPVAGDYVSFHAYMRNGDSVIYSSRDQPKPPFLQIPGEAPANRPPNPLEEVMQLMGMGDSATVMIAIDTLDQKPKGFEDTDVMYYDLVIADIKSAQQQADEQNAQMEEAKRQAEELKERLPEVEALVQETLESYQNNTLGDQLQETGSGLKYVIHEEGDGAQAAPGKVVGVHYYGVLAEDGERFDDSFSRGQPIDLPLGQGRVIPGWEEGIALFKGGTKATLFIPAPLGYGEAGSPPTIPGGAELMFYVELGEVQ
ncbi:MAG: FKBP-type peptidyl-prolyl cis-trans isomerase [Phaeodactylibacter sp.]|uniref:FKBP-type peptidyl-prolyl cis-trans isomerase n=1 Tax=Phaeodactylibacter sp. TaxID=1940289 RepID=UPI0032F01289